MRVAVVSHSAWLGGAERCLAEGVAALLARGHEVRVAVPAVGPLAFPGARVDVVPSRWWAGDGAAPPVDRAGASAAVDWLRTVAPDVVLSSTIVQPAGALAARELGLPHAWWVHELGDLDHGFSFALGASGTRRAVRELSHVVLAPSETVASHLGGAVVVPYAVDVPVVDVVPVGRPRGSRLVVVGRVRPSKGQRLAVAALALLPADVTLDVWGAGFEADLDALRAAATADGTSGRLRLRGEGSGLDAFDAADVVLVPSRMEAFGRVTVEAWKRGKPVVGSASGGTGELLRAGGGGVAHAPGDPSALAAAVLSLLDDPARRLVLARAGHAHAVQTYSGERLGAALEAALAKAVAARAPAPA